MFRVLFAVIAFLVVSEMDYQDGLLITSNLAKQEAE